MTATGLRPPQARTGTNRTWSNWPWRSVPMRQVLAYLRSEHLAPQRPEEEIDGALRGGHAAAFNVVGRKDLLQGMRGEHLAQFGPRAAVSLAGRRARRPPCGASPGWPGRPDSGAAHHATGSQAERCQAASPPQRPRSPHCPADAPRSASRAACMQSFAILTLRSAGRERPERTASLPELG